MATVVRQTADDGATAVGTRYPEVFAALAAMFEPNEIFVRSIKNPDGSSRQEHYIRSRAVMNRLDNVVGPENWEESYAPFGTSGSVQCSLTLTMPDGRKVRKSGVGSPNRPDQPNSDKSAESDSLKRAALKFGVGRYLYRDGVPEFASELTGLEGPAVPLTPLAAARFEEHERGPARVTHQQPQATHSRPEPSRPAPGNGHGHPGGPPRTGKALFAWQADAGKRYGVDLLKYLQQWGKLQSFPARMVDWGADEVMAAYAEATRKLAEFSTDRGDAYEDALAN